MVSGDMGVGRLGFIRFGLLGVCCVLRSRLLIFFMKTVFCREYLFIFSFRIEMLLRVL